MAGATAQEEALAVALGECWDMFLKLPIEHPDDRDEFRRGIHSLQNIVLARPALRSINARAT
ncbi:hypothetical protein [Pelagerythrobacter marinus]|uniref:hypothetical protein n=1 Tax=Pelagerythrobacter marinus TaxID=538382 RepID=UPI002AC8A935|nr:hypothetical protein [Pelagerythrobacter marinus]WPZ06578.1 hypothetical protein T8T98_14370 [Pelagerythrobacter marinus]